MAEMSKLRVLRVLDIMKKSDEAHPLNSTQIVERLKEYGIDGERKSIGRDIQCLEDAGFSIKKCENHNDGWYMTDQDFEDWELKMLADAVTSAKFLTMEDTRALLAHIKGLATQSGEALINATTVTDPEMKLQNPSFKQKFDTVITAIAQGKMISFRYVDLGPGNSRIPRKNGRIYEVSPYFLTLDREEYFVICSILPYNDATPFRLEMMEGMELVEKPARPMSEIEDLKDVGNGRSIADYLRETVQMWHCDVVNIMLRGENQYRHVVIKQFGHNISIRDDGKDYFVAHVKASDGPGFCRWLAQYGLEIEVLEPAELRNEYKNYLTNTLAMYF